MTDNNTYIGDATQVTEEAAQVAMWEVIKNLTVQEFVNKLEAQGTDVASYHTTLPTTHVCDCGSPDCGVPKVGEVQDAYLVLAFGDGARRLNAAMPRIFGEPDASAAAMLAKLRDLLASVRQAQ